MKVFRETIITPERSSFLVRRFEEERFSSPFHDHPEIELTYIVASSGTRIIGDHIANFATGDLCLIGENLPHVYRNAKTHRGKAVSEVLHFHRDFAHGLLDATPELESFSRLLDRAKQGLAFDAVTSREVGGLLSKMRESTETQRWSLFFGIVDILSRAEQIRSLSSPGYANSVSPHETERIQDLCQYILEHYHEPLSQEAMARRIHVTKSHFSRIFKRATRKTYQEFLAEVRLGHACRLLVETDMAIIDVAFESGFNNLSNFNRRFRSRYDLSPREYRKRIDLG